MAPVKGPSFILIVPMTMALNDHYFVVAATLAAIPSAMPATIVDANAGAFLPERGFVMRNRIDMDPKHSRAIVQEIGERLRAFLKEEPELPGSLRTQIDRLRELEEQSPSIIPAAERWDKRRR